MPAAFARSSSSCFERSTRSPLRRDRAPPRLRSMLSRSAATVGHEVDDVDRLVALDLGCLEVLLLHEDVLALLELERLDDLVVRDRLILLLADLLVTDRAALFLMHEVEMELVLLDRAVQAHGNVGEAERDRTGPDRAWHAGRDLPLAEEEKR